MSDGLRKIAFIVMLLAALGWIAGCAAGSQALLAEDYKAMDNENLLRYYYRLNDEIERQEKRSGPQFSVGIGGFGGSIGGGAEVGAGGTRYTVEYARTKGLGIKNILENHGPHAGCSTRCWRENCNIPLGFWQHQSPWCQD